MSLDLSDQALVTIDLPEEPGLTHLDLSRNRIESTQGIETCYGLKVIDLSYNLLRYIERWSCLSELMHVDISHNQLKTLFGLRQCFKLETLNASYNLLRVVEGLEGLENLRELDLSFNQLRKVESSIRVLCFNSRLQVLRIEGNLLKGYRTACCSMLPGLLELDGKPTPPSSYVKANRKSGYADSIKKKPNSPKKPHYMTPIESRSHTPLSFPLHEKPTTRVSILNLPIPPKIPPRKRSPFRKPSISDISLSSSSDDDPQTYTFGSEYSDCSYKVSP